MYYCNKFYREEKQFSTTTYSNKLSKVFTNKCDIDGQPEIAVWPSKPEVLISVTVWQTSLQFRRQTFYQGAFAETVNRLFSTTTGNSDVAAKTGNSYITGTTTDSVEISTANRVFLTIAGPNNVSRFYCDNVRQPEMALWPTKLEILISLEPRQVGRQFRLQTQGFAATPSSKKLTPSDCDNDRQPEMKT